MRTSSSRENEEVRPDEFIKVIKTEPKPNGLQNIPVTPGNYRKFKGKRHASLPKGIFFGILGLILLFVGGSIISFYVFRGRVANSLSTNIDTLRAGVNDLQNLDPQAAQQKFDSIQNVTPSDFGSVMNALGFLFKGETDAVSSFSEISKQLITLSGQLGSVESSTFNFFVNGDGNGLVKQLVSLQTSVTAIDNASNKLSNAASVAGGFASIGGGDFYLSLKSQIEGARKFLEAFVPWLSNPQTHHVLVLLGNPSEIRPGGGFLGSYADVTLTAGNITDIIVHDIADVDVTLAKKIIPPKPLQPITTNWRPADANWFFDFPTTAKKTIELFEEANLYGQASTTFDGAIAVSPKVISDLLAITGPISIGKPTTTFTSGNFLIQIQKIVQNGQSTSATYPKQILRDLSDAVFAKLASSTDVQRQQMLGLFLDWTAKKDAMVYFKDPALENFVVSYGAGGSEFEVPQKFNGDYLAAVDANIGGGKSDIYVSSTVNYTAQINNDGTINDHLVVTRKHNGNTSPYTWYKTTSQDYLQVITPDGTSLTNASGGIQRVITAPADYAKGGYSTDPLVASIETTEKTLFGYPTMLSHDEMGKKVFTTWLTVKAGGTTNLTLDYTHRMFSAPAEGVTYQFVFEQQAATAKHYKFDINAPLGFEFLENGLATFSYESDDPPGSLTIPLTLERIPQ